MLLSVSLRLLEGAEGNKAKSQVVYESMNEGVSGWYGLVLVLFLAGLGVTIASVLGAAALRLMLKDETYFPEER